MGLHEITTRLLRCLPPETAHHLAVRALRFAPVRKPSADPANLNTTVLGMSFSNPLGMAAGFDKDADVPAALLGLGFGFVEVGSITPEPQPGNPRPRVFRLAEDGAVINRYGFNSKGLDHAERRLKALRRAQVSGPIGVNLGKNKLTEDAASDYAKGAAHLARYADYLVINVSSPNTPGLRALQGKDDVLRLIDAVRSATTFTPPLLLKIAPDMTEQDLTDIASVAVTEALNGVIVTNTTVDRQSSLQSVHAKESGGLSGAPLFQPSTQVLRDLFMATNGDVPLIGVGGISSGAEAYAKIRAGASLVQLYTAMTLTGPDIIPKIKNELSELLTRDGLQSVSEAVGAEHASQ
jgi:dihydroorotate dehydrogenase